ncbi:MAG: hypothetical protein NVSMB1_08120 [Polyangiales bacterium]
MVIALTIGPTSPVGAASPDASVSSDAGPPTSIYLSRAQSGVVLPPSIEDAEAFCALVLACRDVPMFPPANDFTGCVHALMNQLSSPSALTSSVSIRECGLSATSCRSLRACALKGASEKVCDGVALDSKEPIGKCDLDARAVTCWRGKVLGVRNCGLADELCVVKDGKSECALAGACPPSAKADWACAGSRMVKCQDNKFLSIDCKVLSLSCVSALDASGKQAVGCAPATTSSCKSSEKVTCAADNGSAVSCLLGKEVRVACSDQGMSCTESAKAGDRQAGVCEIPAGSKPCEVKKFESKCDGSTIKYCSHGSVRTYSCKSIGASKCVMDKGSGPRCTG